LNSPQTICVTAMANRVVLVVGAHGGVGQAAALALARVGTRLILLGHKVPKLNQIYDAVLAAGGQALLYPLDLEGATPADYAELAARIGHEYGSLHGIFHCAAHFRSLTPLELTEPGEFARGVRLRKCAGTSTSPHAGG